MAKTNSLKIAPYLPRRISQWVYDESIDRKRDWDAYLASGKQIVTFEGYTLMEYTSGAPGEQEDAYGIHRGGKIEWRDNVPFEATLTIRELERGRSAARFWFEDEATKTRYPFFGQTLVDMLSASVMDHGKVKGTWIVVKKGANYGIELHQ